MKRFFDPSSRSLSPLGYLGATTALALALAFVIGAIPWGGARPAHAVVAVHAALAPENVPPTTAAGAGAADDVIPPVEQVPSAAYN